MAVKDKTFNRHDIIASQKLFNYLWSSLYPLLLVLLHLRSYLYSYGRPDLHGLHTVSWTPMFHSSLSMDGLFPLLTFIKSTKICLYGSFTL